MFSLSYTLLPLRDCGQRIPHAKVVTTSLHCFCDPDFIHCIASFFPFLHESTLNCFLLYCHCIHVCYNCNLLMHCALQINLLVGLSNVIHALEVFIFVNPTHKAIAFPRFLLLFFDGILTLHAAHFAYITSFCLLPILEQAILILVVQ